MDWRKEGGREQPRESSSPLSWQQGNAPWDHVFPRWSRMLVHHWSAYGGPTSWFAPNWLFVKFRDKCFNWIRTKEVSLLFIWSVFTNVIYNCVYSNCAAIRSVRLRLPCLSLSVISCTFTWLKASLTNHCSEARVHRLHKPWSMNANAVVETREPLCLNCLAAALSQCWEVSVREAWCTLAGRSREQHC